MVDVGRSRKECAEFIAAEGSRNAFSLSTEGAQLDLALHQLDGDSKL